MIRIYKGLIDEDARRPENDFAFYLEEAALVTLGLCYERRGNFAGGAFALFEPSQQSLLYQHIIAPEGRLHFAGEHTSLCHAWIQGAIESGLRAALEVNAAA